MGADETTYRYLRIIIAIGLIGCPSLRNVLVEGACTPSPCEVARTVAPLLSADKPCRYRARLNEIGSESLNETLYRARVLGFLARLVREGACVPPTVNYEFIWVWHSKTLTDVSSSPGMPTYRRNSVEAPFEYGPGLTFHVSVFPNMKDPVLNPSGKALTKEDKPLAMATFTMNNLKPPFTVEFVGGNFRPVYDTGDFIVNASLSFDPDDVVRDKFDHSKFTWYCNVTGKNSFQRENELNRLYGPGFFAERRRKRQSSPKEPSPIPDNVVVPPFCCKPGDTKCKPMNQTKNVPFITLDSEAFPSKDQLDYGIWLVIENSVWSGELVERPSSHGQQVLNFIPTDHVIHEPMRLKCLYNCWGEIDPADKVVFEAVCEKDPCLYTGIVWEAVTNPQAKELALQFVHKFQGDCIDTNERDRYLVMRRNCLALNQEHEFSLGVNYGDYTDLDHTEASGKVLINTRKPFVNGTCTVTPTSGFELVTVFTVTCEGFSRSTLKPFSILKATYHQTVVQPLGRKHEMNLYFSTSFQKPIRLHLAGGQGKGNLVQLKVRVTEDQMVYADTVVNVKVEPLQSDGDCLQDFFKCMVKIKVLYLDQLWFLGDIRRSLQMAQIMLHMLNRDTNNETFYIFTKQNLRMQIAKRVEKEMTSRIQMFIEQSASVLRLLLMGDPLEMTIDLMDKVYELLQYPIDAYFNLKTNFKDISARAAESLATKILLVINELLRIPNVQATDEFTNKYLLTFGNLTENLISTNDEYFKNLCQEEILRTRQYLALLVKLETPLRAFVFMGASAVVLDADGVTAFFQAIPQRSIQTSSNFSIGDHRMNVAFHSHAAESNATSTRHINLRLIVFHSYNLRPGKCSKLRTNGTTAIFDASDFRTGTALTDELGEVIYRFRPNYAQQVGCYGMIVDDPKNTNKQRQNIHTFTVDSFGDVGDTLQNVHLSVVASPGPSGLPFRLYFSNSKPNKMYYDESSHANSGTQVTRLMNFEVANCSREMYVSAYLDKQVAEEYIKESGKQQAVFYYNFTIYQYSCFHTNDNTSELVNTDEHKTRLVNLNGIETYLECVYPKIMSTHSINVKPVAMGRFGSPKDISDMAPRPTGGTGQAENKVPWKFLINLSLFFLFLLLLAFCLDGCCKHTMLATVPRDVNPDTEFQHAYLMSVSTGAQSGASTLVSFCVHGSLESSQVHLLTNMQRDVLKRWREEHYLVFTKLPLGQIETLYVYQRPRAFLDCADPENTDDEDTILTPWLSLRDVFIYDVENVESVRFGVYEELEAPSERRITGKHVSEDAPEEEEDQGFCQRFVVRFQESHLFACCFCSFCCRPSVGDLPCFIRVAILLLLLFIALFIDVMLRGFPYTKDDVSSDDQDESDNYFDLQWRVIHSEDIDYLIITITAFILLLILVVLIRFSRRLFLAAMRWFVYIDLDDSWMSDLETWRQNAANADKSEGPCSDRSCVIGVSVGGSGTLGRKHKVQIKDKTTADDIADGAEPCTVEAKKRHEFQVCVTVSQEQKKQQEDSTPQMSTEDACRYFDQKDPDHRWEGGNSRCGISACCRTAINRNRAMFCSLLGLLIFVPLVIFATLFVVLGLRMNADDTRNWIISSLIGLAVCLIILHPLYLIFVSVFAPQRRRQENRSAIREEIYSALAKRQDMIQETGTIAEYQEYLRLLRLHPAYRR